MNQSCENSIDQTQFRRIPFGMIWIGKCLLIAVWFLFVWFNIMFTAQWLAGNITFFHAVKYVYFTSTVLAPPLFLVVGFIVFLISRYHQNDHLLFWGSVSSTILALLLIGIRGYATYYEPYNLRIHNVEVYSHKIKHPFRLLHISDIQSPKIDWYEKWVFIQINKLNPDLIIHTGDLLQPVSPATFDSEMPKIAKLFESLDIPYGIYGVYGDTDLSLHRFSKQQLGGYHNIEDESLIVGAHESQFSLLGLSLNSSAQGNASLIQTWLNEGDKNTFRILFGHRPDYLMRVTHFDIDLCLAGHTHGGQVVIPFLGPLVINSQVPKKWARGFHEVDSIRFHVSAGIGSEHVYELPSIRVNCPPEMTMIRLLPQ